MNKILNGQFILFSFCVLLLHWLYFDCLTSSMRACCVARAIPTNVCFHLPLHYLGTVSTGPNILFFCTQSLRWVHSRLSTFANWVYEIYSEALFNVSDTGLLSSDCSSLASPKLASLFGFMYDALLLVLAKVFTTATLTQQLILFCECSVE